MSAIVNTQLMMQSTTSPRCRSSMTTSAKSSRIVCCRSASSSMVTKCCSSVPGDGADCDRVAAGKVSFFDKAKNAAGKALVVAAATASILSPASALTYDELQGMTYKEVKGTGVANTCPTLAGGTTDTKDMPAGTYNFSNFCVEPTSFTVREDSQLKGGESQFVPTHLVTRLTYTLADMSGKMVVGPDGQVSLKEEGGIDYAPVTVRLPGGEHVPFMFTVANLDAKGTLGSFAGDFTVASYRGSTFMDPRGRGGSTGYDSAIGLYAAQDDDSLEKENIKNLAPRNGSMVLSVTQMDPVTGEVSGVFESLQPSDNDMGAKSSKDVKVTGVWYSQLDLA